MASFLEKLEENYDLFVSTDGEIIKLFTFPKDFYLTMYQLLRKSNSLYEKNCQDANKNPNELHSISVKLDKFGDCYLEIIGNDERTRVIIQKEKTNAEGYKKIQGYKISEDFFASFMDFIQRRKLETAGISSRFLKETPDKIDLNKELNIDFLIEYFEYLNENLLTESFIEPTGTISRIKKTGATTSIRKNPIVPFDIRKQELIKYKPKRIIRFNGKNTNKKQYAFLYEHNGNILVVVEPESGVEYQYNLNLGPIDIKDNDLITEMIKAALEAEEEIVMYDDAIIRKNHTTFTAFKENLEIFLKDEKSLKPFYHDVKDSYKVYR